MANEPDKPIPEYQLPEPLPEEVLEGTESLSEEIALAGGLDLQSHKTRNQINGLLREESAQTHQHRIVVCGLYVVAISAGLLFLAVIYHLLSPHPFLSPEQLADIKQLLFSGALGAVSAQLARKHLGVKDDRPSA